MATKVRVELDELGLKSLVLKYIRSVTGDQYIELEDIKIETKSTQNYRAEWEQAEFRAVAEVEK